MLVYNSNSQGQYDIWDEKIELVTTFKNGTRLSKRILATLVNTVDSEREAQAFIAMEKNMIARFEAEECLREEYENNLESY
jgi:hypothetical protein